MLAALGVFLSLAIVDVPRSEMPNLTQTDYKFMPGGGRSSCCPTATANGLLWLDANGVKGLVPEGKTPKDRTEALLKRLAAAYQTDDQIGTTWNNFVPGLQKYLADNGYRNSQLSFFTKMKSKGVTSSNMPSLGGMEDMNTAGGFVMVALGFFKNPDASGRATRTGWHWATLIKADRNEDRITLHDPRPQQNDPKQPLTLKATMLTKDRNMVLLNDIADNHQTSEGLYWLRGYPLPADEFAVIEGVLLVKPAK